MESRGSPKGIGTWHRYKLGQAQFTSWLKKTAEKLSTKKPEQQQSTAVETPPQQSRRQKKPKPKPVPVVVDVSEETSVHWSQLEVLAQRVADNATPNEIPEAAIRILRDVVGLRKKSFKFFSTTTKESDDNRVKQSNANHAHIIGVLERILAKLEGLASTGPNREAKRGTRDNAGIDISDLSNMFAFLEVQPAFDTANGEDNDVPVERDEGAPKRSKTQTRKAGKKKGDKKQHKNKREERQLARVAAEDNGDGSWIDRVDFGMSAVDYGDNSEDELDHYMMLYCYFVDFNAIRSYVAERWCDYWYDRSVPLCTLSVITNAAFELFHQLEVDFVRALKSGPEYQRMADYDFMLSTLFFELGIDHIDYDSYEGLSSEEFSERIWRDEADWLAFSSWSTITRMLSMIPYGKVPSLPPSKQKPVVYGANDMTSWQAFENDVTNQLILEMCEFKALKKMGGAPNVLPAEPELLLDLQRSLETRNYRSPMIFSLQLWVDIRNIMETEVIRPFEQMQVTAAKLKAALDSHNPGNMFDNNTFRGQWIKRSKEITRYMLEDVALESRKIRYQGVGIDEEPLPFYLLKNEPVWAGLLDFRAKLAGNQMGHQFTMLSPVVEAAAYLYHAAIAADPDLAGWDMMRKYVDTYNDSSVFRVGLRQGQTAPVIINNFKRVIDTYHNRTKALNATDGGKTFTHAVDIRQSLYERYAWDGGEDLMDYMEEITKYRLRIEQDAWENRRLRYGPATTNDGGPSETADSATGSTTLVKHTASTLGKLDDEREKELRRKATLSQLSPTEMLQLLDDTVTSQLEGLLTLDYFQLFDESAVLLKGIYDSFGPDLQARIGFEDLERPARLGLLPVYLGEDLEKASGTGKEQEIIGVIVDVLMSHLASLDTDVAVRSP